MSQGQTANVSIWKILTAMSVLATATIRRATEISMLVTPFIREGSCFGGIWRHPLSIFKMYTPKYARLVVRSFKAHRTLVGETNRIQRKAIG